MGIFYILLKRKNSTNGIRIRTNNRIRGNEFENKER